MRDLVILEDADGTHKPFEGRGQRHLDVPVEEGHRFLVEEPIDPAERLQSPQRDGGGAAQEEGRVEGELDGVIVDVLTDEAVDMGREFAREVDVEGCSPRMLISLVGAGAGASAGVGGEAEGGGVSSERFCSGALT